MAPSTQRARHRPSISALRGSRSVTFPASSSRVRSPRPHSRTGRSRKSDFVPSLGRLPAEPLTSRASRGGHSLPGPPRDARDAPRTGGGAAYAAKRCSERAFALAASTSRFFGGAVVTRWSSSLRVAASTSATACSKAASLACEGLLEPLILRTYWRAEEWVSSAVAGGSKLWRVLMFLHMGRS